MKADFDNFRNRTGANFRALFDDNVPQDKIDVRNLTFPY